MPANLRTISLLRSLHPSPAPHPWSCVLAGMLPSRPRGVASIFVALAACVLSPCSPAAAPAARHAPNPATIVPASAPLYIGAIVQPSGTLKTNTEATARKLTHSGEPFSGLLKLLSPSGQQLNYASEVKPWLGANAGAFLTSIDAAKATHGAHGHARRSPGRRRASWALAEGALRGLLANSYAQGAIVLDTTDVGKARSFLQARAKRSGRARHQLPRRRLRSGRQRAPPRGSSASSPCSAARRR